MTPPASLANLLVGMARPVPFSSLLRHDIVPVGCTFLAFLGVQWWYFRTSLRPPSALPPETSPEGRAPGWRRLMRYALVLAIGGYLVFVLIIGVFYFVLGDAGAKYLREGFGLGAALAFGIALPGLLAIAAMAELWQRRPGSRG